MLGKWKRGDQEQYLGEVKKFGSIGELDSKLKYEGDGKLFGKILMMIGLIWILGIKRLKTS